jgi:predicted enzyme related to lactoylglutathione lyase
MLAVRSALRQAARMPDDIERLVAVVLRTADLDRAVHFYGTVLGLDLHIEDHDGDDQWTSGRHAATSWTDGAFMHFAIYETKDGAISSGVQIAFRVTEISTMHERVADAGVEVIHAPKPQPWGISARYRDHDGNVIELTQTT